MTTVFVAGSRKLGRLNEEVRVRLNNLITQKYRILVGDANGADKAVQKFLSEHEYKDVVVYCSGKQCRNNVGHWDSFLVEVDKSLKGRDFYAAKDKKMAEDADYGLMIWDGESIGTLTNVLELLNQSKKSLVYFSPDKQFLSISHSQQLEDLLKRCRPDAIETIKKKVRLTARASTSAQGALDF